jgi:hypothetical protein
MRNRNFGRAWLALAIALGLHAADEAAHDFLSWYNPMVTAIRQQIPWLPLPVFEFNQWIAGLAAAVLLLVCLSPLAYQGSRALRLIAIPFGALMTANGLAHIAVSVANGRLMPGVLSAPVLLACSVWLLLAARRLPAPVRV